MEQLLPTADRLMNLAASNPSSVSGKNSMTLNGQPIPYYPPNKTYK